MIAPSTAKFTVSICLQNKNNARKKFKKPLDWELWCAALALHLCIGLKTPTLFTIDEQNQKISKNLTGAATNTVCGITQARINMLVSHIRIGVSMNSSVIVYGSSMSGKTSIIREAARSRLIRPVLYNSMPVSDMIASYDNNLKMWSVGYIPKLLSLSTPTWIILDGDMNHTVSSAVLLSKCFALDLV